MIDYFKAFDENYIPIDVAKGIEQQTEEMFNMFVDQYRTLQFQKDYSRIYEGILSEDYAMLKNAAHSIKGALGYLNPIIVDKVSNELQIFIRERIEDKDGKRKQPFLEEDKIKVYKDSLFILTEMVALLRYFHKQYADFSDQYNHDSAKKLIDQCYKFYFERFKIPYAAPKEDKKLDKQQTSQTERLQKSQQFTSSQVNENSQIIKESSVRQTTQEKDDQGSKKAQKKVTVPIKEENSTVLVDSIHKKEEGVGSNDIQLEQQEKIQPCCNACNIF